MGAPDGLPPGAPRGGRRNVRRPRKDPLAPLQGRPSSYYLHGVSRTEVNLVAYCLARALEPEFHWIEVTRADPPSAPTSPPAQSGSGEPRRHLIYRDAALTPERPLSEETLGRVVVKNEPTKAVSHIRDFVRLPDILQDLLTRPARPDHGRVILLSNTDLTESQYAPEPGTFMPFLRAAAEEGASLICSRTGTDRPNRFDFDFVLRIDLEANTDIGLAMVTVEKGQPGTPFETGARRLLRDDPVLGRLARALEE